VLASAGHLRPGVSEVKDAAGGDGFALTEAWQRDYQAACDPPATTNQPGYSG